MTTEPTEHVYLSLTELATEFRTTREILRSTLSRAGVGPTGGSKARPLYRLKDVLEVIYIPTYHSTLPSSRDPRGQ